jgi:acetyl-CoA acetyltransferase
MGESAALTALEWEIGRQEQDELAVASHQHLSAAYDSGFFDDLVTPFLGVERDTNLRPDSSLEKLAALKPVFGSGEGATMTAANSTPADGRCLHRPALLRGLRQGAGLGAAGLSQRLADRRRSTTSTVATAC